MMKHSFKINFKILLILMGAGALLLRFLFSLNPYITEAIYSKGIFLGIRFCLDYTVELLPFPLIYLLIALPFLLVFIKIIHWFSTRKNKTKPKIPFKTRFVKGLLRCSAVIGTAVFLFYFLWGFNYERLPIEVHLKIKPEPLDINSIRHEAALAFQMIVNTRGAIPGVHPSSRNALDHRFLPNDLENKIRTDLEDLLKAMNYPTTGRVRVKKFWPGGLLMRLGTSGLYFPFTGEAYFPANLTAVEIPFVMAHEMAHGYGFSQEGTANFLAYLTCISSTEPFIQYSGWLVYFSHISGDLYRASPHEYDELNKKLPAGIISDRIKKYRNWQQYRGWLMDWGEKVYDTYLKSQGVNEGIKSYDRLVVLTAAWRKTSETF